MAGWPVCGRCGKRIYRDRIAAVMDVERLSGLGNVNEAVPQRAYFDKRCRKWHITKQKRRTDD